MEQRAQLIRQRGRVRARLTNFKTFVAKLEYEPEKRVELSSRIEKAEQLWIEFDTIQNKIEDIDESDEQEIERADFEDSYHKIITDARRLSMTDQPIVFPSPRVDAQSVVQGEQFAIRPIVKLPSIDLPKFDGNYER